MINEEKVKELFYVAKYDTEDDRLQEQATTYFGWDFVWKEALKSFFTGTIAFACLLILWVMYDAEKLLEDINSIDITSAGMTIAFLYIAFIVVYIFLTVIIYSARYKAGRKRAKKYIGHLKKVAKMYERDEKLKR